MKRIILALILAITICLSGTATFVQAAVSSKDNGTVKFTDIKGHWAETAINKIMEKSTLPGVKDKFVPGRAITRSEFAIMLHDALDIEINYFKAPDISDYFTDIRKDAPYANAVIDLVTANILDDEGKIFNPDGKLTREQMVHYIMNAMKYKMGDIFAYIKIKGGFFKDHNEIAPKYSGDVDLAAYYKLISGYGNNIFKPRAYTKRAEAAKVICNLVEYLEKENSKNVTIIPDALLTGESLEMKISLINNTDRDIIFEHSSGQKYDFVLLDKNRKEIYVWSADKSFLMALITSTLEAGKSIEFSETISGDEFKAIKDKAVYLKAYLMAKSDSFVVDPDGYEIKFK